MDWQTKEYIDSRFDDLDEKMDLIMQNLNIQVEDDEYSEDYEDEALDDDNEESVPKL